MLGGTATFTERTYTEAGSHTYKIREELPEGANATSSYTVNGITYDPNTHTVKVVLEVLLGDLPSGMWRKLTDEEVRKLIS